MPRVEFECYKDASPWLQRFIKNSDKGYIGYYTSNHELIFVPTKSTHPVIYGYVRICGEKDAEEFGKSAKIDIFKIQKFEWNAERGMPLSEV